MTNLEPPKPVVRTIDALTPATQVSYPWKATLRTVIQSAAGAALAIAAFVAGLNVFAPQFVDAVQAALPPEWGAYLTAGVAILASISGAVARVMAIPGVNEWLTKIKLGAEPKA